jgi:hypothetical protein
MMRLKKYKDLDEMGKLAFDVRLMLYFIVFYVLLGFIIDTWLDFL